MTRERMSPLRERMDTLSAIRRANASDGKHPLRSFVKRCWRKCDETPTISQTRVAVHVSLALFQHYPNKPTLMLLV